MQGPVFSVTWYSEGWSHLTLEDLGFLLQLILGCKHKRNASEPSLHHPDSAASAISCWNTFSQLGLNCWTAGPD